MRFRDYHATAVNHGLTDLPYEEFRRVALSAWNYARRRVARPSVTHDVLKNEFRYRLTRELRGLQIFRDRMSKV